MKCAFWEIEILVIYLNIKLFEGGSNQVNLTINKKYLQYTENEELHMILI